VLWAAEFVVDEGDVEAELAGVLGFEFTGFEFDNDVPELFDVKEKQVDVEVITVNIEVHLAPNKGEARPEFLKCSDDVIDESLLDVSFVHVAFDPEEVQDVEVFDNLLGQVGVGWFEDLRKIGRGCFESGEGLSADVMLEHVPGPPAGHALLGVPGALVLVVEPAEEDYQVPPRQLVSKLLTEVFSAAPGG
jgi:hypothetical protein